MGDHVSTLPQGIGEAILYQDLEHRFQNWRNVRVSTNYGWAWKAISHLEAGGFSRPGDGPVLAGLASSSIVAGSDIAEVVYARTATQGSRTGAAWDTDPTLSFEEKIRLIQEDLATQNEKEYGLKGVVSYSPEDLANNPDLADQFTPQDEGFSLWGSIKGVSRWAFLAFDMVPEGIDAVLRAAHYINQGDLSIGEAAGGILGVNREAAHMVGVPLFSYLADINPLQAGGARRLNMGTGFFAQGEVADDVQNQLDMYDSETQDTSVYNAEVERTGGRVLVPGLGGEEHQARNFEEWQYLRNNAGRAALLASFQNTPQQVGMGIPYGTFNEGVYDEAAVYRTKYGPQNYSSISAGRVGASAVGLEPESAPYNVLSGSLDFGKQLIDLPLLKLAKGSMTVLSRVNPFIGLADESGQLIRGTNTLNDIRRGVDQPAFGSFIADASRGSLDVDKATNALARNADMPLANSVDFINTSKKSVPGILDARRAKEVQGIIASGTDAAKAENIVKPVLSENQVTSLINRAIDGDKAAEGWLRGVMSDAPDMTDELLSSKLDDLRSVSARPGVDLKAGVYGQAQVDEAQRLFAQGQVQELADLLAEGKAGVYETVQKGQRKLVLSYDAELGRAQSTMRRVMDSLGEKIDELTEQKKVAQALDDARRRAANPTIAASDRSGLLNTTIPRLTEEARKVGVNPDDLAATFRKKLPSLDGARQGFTTNLFNDNFMSRRWAEKLLGGTDEAVDDVDNLVRVLRRNDEAKDLLNHMRDYRPRIEPDRLSDLLTGEGGMRDMVRSLKEANTIAEVRAILGPSLEFHGAKTIPAAFLKRVADAADETEIVQAFMDLGRGIRLNPQRMTLLGNHAKAAALTTGLGAAIGGVGGAYEQYQLGGGAGDIIGGGIGGTVAGALIGSGVSGIAGAATGGLNREIASLADRMDVLLAGTRAATTDVLRARGVPMGVAQQGLGAASQLGYAFGHSPLGRRIARSAGDGVSLADPDDLFYKMDAYARNLGLAGDEVIHKLVKGTGDQRVVRRIVQTRTDDIVDIEKQIADLIADGFKLDQTRSLDMALGKLATITPNNVARGWEGMRTFMDTAAEVLAARGMSDNVVKLLTDFTDQGISEFLGNLDGAGNIADLAQSMAINGNVMDMKNQGKLLSELWSGNIHLPPPNTVKRAVDQLDTMGKITQAFTGKGVVSGIYRELTKKGFEPGQARSLSRALTPELEYNIGVRIARAVTGTLWVPAVLLTRPLSFLSKVLGEDQFRMTALGLDSFFIHPFRYFSGVMSNWHFWRSQKLKPALRGVAGRSLIPPNLIDETGNLADDVLDSMNEWQASEHVQQALGIFDRKASRTQRLFGSPAWGQIARQAGPDQPGFGNYVKGVATEFRQLLSDPIIRHMSRSVADDPIEDTLNWLLTQKEGQIVARRWGAQFASKKMADDFINPANPDDIRAFLEDAWARLHLKTGGDWLFTIKHPNGQKIVIDSRGNHLTDMDLLAAKGWDDLDEGYTIIRNGDEDMLDVIRHGSITPYTMKDGQRIVDEAADPVNVADDLSEQRWEAIQDFVRERHQDFERQARRLDYDELADHRFPVTVKGERTVAERVDTSNRSLAGDILDRMDQGLERIYDLILGRPTNWFSRQPVIGQFYWERVGLLMPSMDAKTANAYMEMARKEGGGTARHVSKIADAAADAMPARNVITDFSFADLNAKAYAVERTKDTLFDLTRQRNFIESMRVVVPFAGPMVEALEAWGRVVRENPVEIWRRGGQVVNGLWADPLSPDPDERRLGMFWRNEDGEEMITVPISGAINGWLQDQFKKGWTGGLANQLPDEGFDMRARGLNVVFGTEDLSAEDQPDVAGFPLAAINPGTGPAFNVAVTPLLKDKEGWRGDFFEYLFPYGTPPNFVESMLPYHLRKVFEGSLGAESQRNRIATSLEQWEAMVANGEVGVGNGYTYDMGNTASVDAAWAEAQQRGTYANWVEGIARGSLPSLVTPEMIVDGTQVPKGFGVEVGITIDAYADESRDLFTPDGAEWYVQQDGSKVSTEGDWGVVTAYMNQKHGTHMYSAELLNMPLSRTLHPRSYTESGMKWSAEHTDLLNGQLSRSGALLMPDYANINATEEFSFKAREQGIDQKWVQLYDDEELKAAIESRLLQQEYRRIELDAAARFGSDEDLEGEAQDEKDAWLYWQKSQAKGKFERGSVPTSTTDSVREQLLTWNTVDWDSFNLKPEELATVRAVLWYTELREKATLNAQTTGATHLGLKGENDDQKAMLAAARADVVSLVEAQLAHAAANGVDMGNFTYIFYRYLLPEFDTTEETDALLDLAEAQQIDLASYTGG